MLNGGVSTAIGIPFDSICLGIVIVASSYLVCSNAGRMKRILDQRKSIFPNLEQIHFAVLDLMEFVGFTPLQQVLMKFSIKK